MDGTGPRQPLSDTQLDRELEGALGVDPSPEFPARVRTRIAAEPGAVPWRLAVVSGFSRIFQRRAVQPLAAVAVVGIVVTIVVPGVMRDEQPVTRPAMADVALPSAARADHKVSLYGNREVVESPPARAQVPRSAARSQMRLDDTRSSEVLISQEEQRAFDALLIAVAQNRLPGRVAAAEPEDRVVIPAVEIQQLTIEPLQLARLE